MPNAIGEVGDLFGVAAGSVERYEKHRRGIGIEAHHAGRIDPSGQIGEHAAHFLLHLLGGNGDRLLEDELNHHLRDTLRRVRAKLVDAADGVHRAFDLVGDLGFDVFR
jgi:hypothetical protein